VKPGESPGDADRRLPEGKRRIGERLAGQLKNTTTDRQDAPRRAVPAVSGVVEVDLSRHVDRGGCVFDDARMAVHRVLATCPDGVAVRVRLGRAVWVADPVLDMLTELSSNVASVEVVGADDRGVGHVVARLRNAR
jgi:hypothetical protein